MTDETSRSGYDDILSSVRRIVSTELDGAADDAAGKLLLTPALRVGDATPQTEAERDYPTLEDRIADLEAAVESETSDWEPDGSEDQKQHEPDSVVLPLHAEQPQQADPIQADDAEVARLAEEAADAELAEVEQSNASPVPEARDPVAAPLATFRHRDTNYADNVDNVLGEEDATLLDESALRELVAEVVREELQGGLGERITRNVRKLVRAEIQRAFAARDLD